MPFDSIWLATDLTDAAMEPWAHALRIAASSSTDLRVLHVRAGDAPPWSQLATPRLLLTKWGYLPEDAGLPEFQELDFHIRLQPLKAQHPTGILEAMIDVERPGLVVLGSHRPGALERWIDGSVAEELARHAPTAVLIVPDDCRPIVAPITGTVGLDTVVVPVGDGAGQTAMDAVEALVEALDAGPCEVVFLHVGPHSDLPQLRLPETPGWSFRTRVEPPSGALAQQVLEIAADEGADLIAMATRGHDSWLDALLGSKTERVLRGAGVPVLTVPVRAGS